jgi:hypothetical protein
VRTRRPAAAARAARRGVRGRASLEAADGDDLILGPDSDGEGVGSAAQEGVGAVVERLKGWDDAAPKDPDEGGGEVTWQLVWQLGARIVPVESLQSHFILTMSHWSSGLPVCFPSQGTQVQILWGVLM